MHHEEKEGKVLDGQELCPHQGHTEHDGEGSRGMLNHCRGWGLDFWGH